MVAIIATNQELMKKEKESVGNIKQSSFFFSTISLLYTRDWTEMIDVRNLLARHKTSRNFYVSRNIFWNDSSHIIVIQTMPFLR